MRAPSHPGERGIAPPLVRPPSTTIQRVAAPDARLPHRLVAPPPADLVRPGAAAVQRRAAPATPQAPARTIQRVSIRLQPQDPVVGKLVGYARNTLRIREPAVDSLAAAAKRMGASENVHLYGHGGNSRIDMIHHDRFGGKSVPELAEEIVANLTFPQNYRGTVYLIGCKTISVVAALRAELRRHTGLPIKVLGTRELLQTTADDRIVLRDPPRDPATARFREAVDMQRHYYDALRALRDRRRATARGLQQVASSAARRAAGIEILKQEELIDANIDAIDAGLLLLRDKPADVLRGRAEGLNDAREAFDEACAARNEVTAGIMQLLALHPQGAGPDHNPDDGALRAKLARLLNSSANDLSTTIRIWALMIQTHDSPDVLQSTPFRLGSMGSRLRPRLPRRPRAARPPQLSMAELGRQMNIYEMLDPQRGQAAVARARGIANALGKRL